ncbi:MAG: aldehyde dehydrogenase family protein [Myxococcota bacterium]
MNEYGNQPGNFIDGRFRAPAKPDGALVIRCPGDLSEQVGIHPFAEADVEEAIEAARNAQRLWKSVPAATREDALRRYQEALRRHQSEIAETIALEVGKAIWDATTEAKALAAKVDLVLGPGASLTQSHKIPEINGELRYRPLGVVAVIGPFNFPAHLPNGQILPALHAGNAVVFKPSEKAPGTAYWLAKCFQEADLPNGLFNVVQGGPKIAERLTSHPEVDGILFTGSENVGKSLIQANLDRPGRLLALELGGKNASIVLDDADVNVAVREIAFSAYVSSGQRCTATSRVYLSKEVEQAFLQALEQTVRSIQVGYPLDRQVFMGPLVEEAARLRLLEAQERAVRAGFDPLVPGGPLAIEGRTGYYVQPSIHRAPSPDIRVAGYTHDELFGPDLAIYPVEHLDEAIEYANHTRYGLSAAVFTKSRALFEHAAAELEVGVLNWNRSSAGASGRLPFGGIKSSGNHHPVGIFAGKQCTYPQALLCESETKHPAWPGIKLVDS